MSTHDDKWTFMHRGGSHAHVHAARGNVFGGDNATHTDIFIDGRGGSE